MRTFVQLVDAGSSTKAAEIRGHAVSAITRRMQSLEKRLGVRLLNRTTRTMSLTEAGQKYYEDTVRILNEIAESEAAVKQTNTELRGRIKVTTPLSFGVAHLVPAVLAFMHAHPEIIIELDMNDRQIDLVEEGYELAIRIGKLNDSSLVARKLGDFQHVVCASPDFFAQFGLPKHPRELQGIAGLCYGNLPQPERWRYRNSNSDNGEIRVNPRLVSTNGDALREAAISGLGVICEPSFIIHSAVDRGLLVPALTEYQWFDMAIFAVFPENRHVSQKVRKFIEYLETRFGPKPYWNDFLEQ